MSKKIRKPEIVQKNCKAQILQKKKKKKKKMEAQNYSKKIRQPKNVSKKIRKPEIVQKNCKAQILQKKKKKKKNGSPKLL